MNARVLFVHALSALHPGVGQGAGVIDLPVAREKTTGLPYIPGSSLKGVFRSACNDKDLQTRVFGPDVENAREYAGSIIITDHRLLLMPVRSLVGTFAWATSPYVLRRLVRDASAAGITDIPKDVPEPRENEECLVGPKTADIAHEGRVILEDLDLHAQADDDAGKWSDWLSNHVFSCEEYWKDTFCGRFCIVHDDVMSFLLETATEVVARVRLEEQSKTAHTGGLWYEEMLPAESILYGLIAAIPVRATPDEVFGALEGILKKPHQIGGKATVGHGLCRFALTGGAVSADA